MIYIIRAGDGDTVKIGFTSNRISLRQRLDQLSIGCPFKLKIEATMGGSKKKERCLHSFCINRHVRGEWFRISKEEVQRMVAKYSRWNPGHDSIKKVPCIHHQKKGAKIKYHPKPLSHE